MTKRREQRRHHRIDHPGGEDTPIRFELFSNERLEQHAVSLAKAQKVSSLKEGRKLIPRVSEEFPGFTSRLSFRSQGRARTTRYNAGSGVATG